MVIMKHKNDWVPISRKLPHIGEKVLCCAVTIDAYDENSCKICEEICPLEREVSIFSASLIQKNRKPKLEDISTLNGPEGKLLVPIPSENDNDLVWDCGVSFGDLIDIDLSVPCFIPIEGLCLGEEYGYFVKITHWKKNDIPTITKKELLSNPAKGKEVIKMLPNTFSYGAKEKWTLVKRVNNVLLYKVEGKESGYLVFKPIKQGEVAGVQHEGVPHGFEPAARTKPLLNRTEATLLFAKLIK